MAGRVWKWTPQKREAVLEALRKGHSRVDAAGVIGGSYDRLRELMRDEPAFSVAVVEAETEGEATAVSGALGDEPTKEDYRYLLEHHPEYRKRWGKNVSITATVTERRDFDWDNAIGPLAAGPTEDPDAPGEGEGA